MQRLQHGPLRVRLAGQATLHYVVVEATQKPATTDSLSSARAVSLELSAIWPICRQFIARTILGYHCHANCRYDHRHPATEFSAMRHRNIRPDKTVIRGLAIAICACILADCDSGRPGRSGLESARNTVVDQAIAPQSGDDLRERADWGDDWLGPARTRTDRAGTAIETRTPRARPGRPTTFWTLVLQTFSQTGHRQHAATMVQELRTAVPQLAGARVHTTSSGSMVIYGNYESAQDPAAQRDKEAIKKITIRDRQAFPRAMLTRIRLQPPPGAMHPYELMSVRQRHPNVNPLYTLQVAVWGDFESGKLTLAQIHQKAEAYATELRVQSFDAYFHHDDDQRLSVVTIGVFDRRAIDPQTGFFSPEVEALIHRFPVHLVNGEPLMEIKNRRDPRRSRQPQTPRLVEVPKL